MGPQNEGPTRGLVNICPLLSLLVTKSVRWGIRQINEMKSSLLRMAGGLVEAGKMSIKEVPNDCPVSRVRDTSMNCELMVSFAVGKDVVSAVYMTRCGVSREL